MKHKKIPVYSIRQCRCGAAFQPASSRQKHCSAVCRFRAIAAPFEPSAGCWEWEKSLFADNGYGQFAETPTKPEYAHRMSYRVFRGSISAGLFVCHACDNRKCFNPAHLFLGTASDNVQDMIRKGRQQDYTNQPRGKDHPNFGHPIWKNHHLRVARQQQVRQAVAHG